MFRMRANIQAMAVPPMQVSGTSTGLGQWSAEKMAPAMMLASQRRLINDTSRFISKEFSAICCISQKVKYSHNRPNER